VLFLNLCTYGKMMESHDKMMEFCLEDSSRNPARQFYELALTALKRNDEQRTRR